jgi:hypothetical protein
VEGVEGVAGVGGVPRFRLRLDACPKKSTIVFIAFWWEVVVEV